MIAAPPEPAVQPSQQQRLKDTRGDQYPAPGSDPKLVSGYVRQLLKDTDADALARYKRATYNLMFVDGRQHIDWNTREKGWKDAPTPEGQARVTMNYIRPILRARQQRLMSSKLSWRALPQSNSSEDRDKATVGTNVLESRWAGTNMDAKVRQANWLAFSCGVAYLKPFWNPDLGALTEAMIQAPHPLTQQMTDYPVSQDGQPIFDPETGDPLLQSGEAFTYRPGDVDTAIRSIFNIRLNPDAFGIESSEGFRWLLDAEVLPISVVKEKYGEAAKNVRTVDGVAQLKQFEGLIKAIGGRSSAQSNELLAGRGGKTMPDRELTLLVEYWEAASDSMPEGRLIVVAGDEVLFDGGLPQEFVPHVPIYDERRPFDANGRPTVDDLVHPQKVINKQWGMILEEQHRNGIGQWAMFDVPGLSNQITNLASGHVKVPLQSAIAGRSIGDIVQRIPPASVSTDRWRLIDQAMQAIFTLGAFNDIQRGQVPPGVDSGIAVQLLQEAENGQLADAVATLKASLVKHGHHTLKLARWGYGQDEERWIPVERPDLGFMLESVNGSDLPDPDTMTLDLEGFRPSSQAAFNAEIKEAMDKGYIDPREGMRQMDLGRGIQGAFESESRHYSRARGENLSIERGDVALIPAPEGTPMAGMPALVHPEDGSPYLLPMNDEHEVHIRLHEEILLDDTKPWPVRQAIALHIAEHQGMMQLLAQQSIAAEAAAQGAMNAATTAA